MRMGTRVAAACAAVAAGGLVVPAVMSAAHAVDLGGENISVHIDNNHLTAPLCITVQVSSRSHGNIIGPIKVCLPAL